MGIFDGIKKLGNGVGDDLDTLKAAVMKQRIAKAQTLPAPGQVPNSVGTPLFLAHPAPQGLVEAGNLDIANRPQVRNPDGSISTVRSISANFDGTAVVLPTVVGDKVLDDNAAVQHYLQTGEHLGKFKSDEEADAYAQALHLQQAKYYGIE